MRGGQGADLLGYVATLGMNAVVSMSHHELETVYLSAPHEEIQQSDGVRPPGYRDQCLTSGQRKGGQMDLETFEQAHPRKLPLSQLPLRSASSFSPPSFPSRPNVCSWYPAVPFAGLVYR